jgi:hypothetical protein
MMLVAAWMGVLRAVRVHRRCKPQSAINHGLWWRPVHAAYQVRSVDAVECERLE